WLEEAWGKAARNFIVRGSPYNKGRVLGDLLAQGLDSVSDPSQCHAVAIDGRSPKYDGGIVTRLDCVPFSLVVNKHGKRFYDEGEDVWPKRYAIWGRLVAKQPDQIAYVMIDSSAQGLFMPTVFPPMQADSIGGLADKLGVPKGAVESTVAEFNAACPKETSRRKFIAHQQDGLATKGITPPKTNWARPLIHPPFYGYSMRVGVTFTYLGLKVDASAKTYAGGVAVDNLWAAGEIMAGNILGQGYLAGIGMTIGTAFGRIAGEEAARYVA
ncbi:MAG: FAD-dependent tricarballylate dehydrogenase TcuA, partial [Proteobacteria bacterium]|nr:FAD-dependent tricarballylate dehydrogenase TcuA [Pseudomonadota bacterium]